MTTTGLSQERVVVTGGSGFIGTNLVGALQERNIRVLSLDVRAPQNTDHAVLFRRIDILDAESLAHIFQEFSPTRVVHLAARTDLNETKDIQGYSANIKGVENIVKVVSRQHTVVRSVFASTKLVCPTDYEPLANDDYCPDTLYGESKVIGEKIIRTSSTLFSDWCIVRPTSIWGPWSMMPHIPYGRFFQMIARGRYFHPGHIDPPKKFGYVGNTVFQILTLLEAPRELIRSKVFYLADYGTTTIKQWADSISLRTRGMPVRVIPELIVQIFARCGDLLRRCGMKEPPFSSFRLRNMRADTSRVPLEELERITGPLPYTMEQGVEETIAWLKKQALIK